MGFLFSPAVAATVAEIAGACLTLLMGLLAVTGVRNRANEKAERVEHKDGDRRNHHPMPAR